MRKFFLVFTAMIALVGLSWGCLPPPNIEGVAFTDQEVIHWDILESLGEPGVNLLKSGQDDTVTFRYLSHYSSDAMAYIGNVGMSYLEGVNLNCMGIILADSIDPIKFDFAEAVAVELNWLADNGVLEISAEEIAAIKTALAEAGGGGVQYWTAQETVLGYNSWYSYDEATGVWGGTQGVKGVDGVNSIRGVYGGCSVVGVAFAAVPEALDAGPIGIGALKKVPSVIKSEGKEINVLGKTLKPGNKARGIAVDRDGNRILLK